MGMIDDGSDPNTIEHQRDYWSGVLAYEAREAAADNDWRRLGKAWGDPESDHAIDATGRRLGNYRTVLRRLQALISTECPRVAEIGAYGGKWTRWMLCARAIHCFDLSWVSADVMRRRFGGEYNIYNYVTDGRSLRGLEDGAVDLVFSMDSLVRAPLDAIGSYLAEFYRVLHPGGHVLVHLPWDDSAGSRERNFTQLDRKWLLAHISQFSRADLDETTLTHGLLLHLVK